MGTERKTEEEADERREAAIASAASLRPNFKLRGGLTEAQLSKFQELHKRRLQIKAKSKVHKGDKDDGKRKSHKKAVEVRDCLNQESSKSDGVSVSVPIPENRAGDIPSMEENNVAGNLAAKKRQKLYWGLDTKERWERKSNM